MSHADRTVRTLLADLAAETVPPAGGTATAVVGAVGASLCELVCRHADDPVDLDGTAASRRLATRRERLLVLADADAAVVDALFGGDGGQRERKRAVGVPLAVAEACVAVLEAGACVVERVDGPVVADAVSGIYLAHGALRAALFTLRENLPVDDAAFVADVDRRAVDLEARGEAAVERATEAVR